MRSLSEMFNVNYFLVSQTNPHIVPALNLKKRVNRKLGNLLEAEWKHRCAVLPTLSCLAVLVIMDSIHQRLCHTEHTLGELFFASVAQSNFGCKRVRYACNGCRASFMHSMQSDRHD